MLHLKLLKLRSVLFVRKILVFCISPRSAIAGLLDTHSGRQSDTKPKHVAVSCFLNDLDPYICTRMRYLISQHTIYDTVRYKTYPQAPHERKEKKKKKKKKKNEKKECYATIVLMEKARSS